MNIKLDELACWLCMLPLNTWAHTYVCTRYTLTVCILQCKVTSIEDRVPEVPKCLMCEEELATVTALPCRHKFCPGILFVN